VRSPAPQDYRVNLENRWHVVYRFFDGHGALLYVGISASAAGRLTAHAVDKPWFREVARAEFEHIHGRSAALERELEIIRAEHPLWNRAGTEKHSKAAGPIRNNEMLDTCPDVVIAFWDGVSKGTKHAIGEASRRGLAVEVYAPGDRDYGKVAA
jgi:hypothetical protein